MHHTSWSMYDAKKLRNWSMLPFGPAACQSSSVCRSEGCQSPMKSLWSECKLQLLKKNWKIPGSRGSGARSWIIMRAHRAPSNFNDWRRSWGTCRQLAALSIIRSVALSSKRFTNHMACEPVKRSRAWCIVSSSTPDPEADCSVLGSNLVTM